MVNFDDLEVGTILRWDKPNVGITIDKIISIDYAEREFEYLTIEVSKLYGDYVNDPVGLKVGARGSVSADTLEDLSDATAQAWCIDLDYLYRKELEQEIKETFNG